MMYDDLRKIFHRDDSNTTDKIYKERFNSSYAHRLGININGGEAFYVVTPDIYKNMLQIAKQDKITQALTSKLPVIALTQYVKQCMIDEITSTNNIEGVYSSRQEINKIIENLEKHNSEIRFLGLVRSYSLLNKRNKIKFDSCHDIRAAYNDLLLDDILREQPKDKPDGKIFRKGPVTVSESGMPIHEGLMPEKKIIEYMEKALRVFNDNNQEPLLRAAVFHYLLGYIHPFYDGNGRLSRFISSWMFAKEYEPIVSYCFSLTINNNLNSYYKTFKLCNHALNKGDLTPFVDFFVSAALETFISLNKNLKEKTQIYKNYLDNINKLPLSDDKRYLSLYDLLLQATLFSEVGISTKDLLLMTETTRTTLRKRLEKLVNKNQLVVNKLGNEKFYKLSNLPEF